MSRLSYTEEAARAAIAESFSWAEALRRLGLCSTGGAWRVLRKHAARWQIPTDHFRPNGRPPSSWRSLEELLIQQSPVRGTKLKDRLYRAGLKQRACEMCGQGEEWEGRSMSLVLDHVNGVRDDNRLENLRILCPNCNATLDTHCGRNKPRVPPVPRPCALCGRDFVPNRSTQRYCSQECGTRHSSGHGPRPTRRVVERPPLQELARLVATLGYSEVARRHGVSDTAVRKWFRAYGEEPPPGPGRRLNPPPRAAPALTDEQAVEALAQIARGTSMYAVAQRFGVSQTAIQDLRHGRTYRHLARPGALRDAA